MKSKSSPNQQALFFKVSDITPLGKFLLVARSQGIVQVEFISADQEIDALLSAPVAYDQAEDTPWLAQANRELLEYFSGSRKQFTLPIDWSGIPPFQKKVLQATQKIPFGGTRTYTEIAQEVGQAQAVRAVGQAEARNPIPIIIPCHRVIGNDGKLHGYGAPGGIKTKAWLLHFEGAL
ncbi:MAG: methylated-DNA--[protein]-cysteine S-methyltransferase [Anaerolineales bacterium]